MNELQNVSSSDLTHARSLVTRARKIVIKVGSNVLVGQGSTVIDRPTFCGLVESIANLMDIPGREVLLVTSGAVAIGRRKRAQTGNPTSNGESLQTKQALAAIGQPMLMHLYETEFDFYGKIAAQLLLTRVDIEIPERLENARNTLAELGAMGNVIPIINENDTVANDEIRFGDNDTLAALVATAVGADLLIILSDVNAIYEADPTHNPNAAPLPHVYGDNPLLDEIAGSVGAAGVGSGGMASKVRAARKACDAGIPTVVAPGRAPGILGAILSGESVGTLLVPRGS